MLDECQFIISFDCQLENIFHLIFFLSVHSPSKKFFLFRNDNNFLSMPFFVIPMVITKKRVRNSAESNDFWWRVKSIWKYQVAWVRLLMFRIGMRWMKSSENDEHHMHYVHVHLQLRMYRVYYNKHSTFIQTNPFSSRISV